jgi:AAHS family 4-hydroxybenzoate transporter-like MFS transporter
MKTVDVGVVLDEGRWSGYQKLLILGTALTIILDGIDNQLLGNAIPSMMKDGRSRAAPLDGARAGPWG